MSFNRWKYKETVVHLYNGVLFTDKKKQIIGPEKYIKELCLLGRPSTTWAMLQPFFAYVIFQVQSIIFGCGWSHTALFLRTVFCIAEITWHHRAQLIDWDSLANVLPGLSFILDPPDLHLSSS
jgi:hypothetical protein